MHWNKNSCQQRRLKTSSKFPVKRSNKRDPPVGGSGHDYGPEVVIICDTPQDDVFQVTIELGRLSTLKGHKRPLEPGHPYVRHGQTLIQPTLLA